MLEDLLVDLPSASAAASETVGVGTPTAFWQGPQGREFLTVGPRSPETLQKHCRSTSSTFQLHRHKLGAASMVVTRCAGQALLLESFLHRIYPSSTTGRSRAPGRRRILPANPTTWNPKRRCRSKSSTGVWGRQRNSKQDWTDWTGSTRTVSRSLVVKSRPCQKPRPRA